MQHRSKVDNRPELVLTDSLGGSVQVSVGNTGALIIVVGDEFGDRKGIILNIEKASILKDFLGGLK